MYDAFISYAREDLAAVRSLERKLDEGGLCAFIDVDRLRAAREWVPQLAKALRDSRMMVLCWSAHAKDSAWVEAELNRYLMIERPVLPWLLDGTSLPSILSRTHGVHGLDPTPVAMEIAAGRRRWIRRRAVLCAALGVPMVLAFEGARRSIAGRSVTFRGHVIDETGNPIGGATVEAEGIRSRTGADGRFSMTLLAPAGHGLRVVVHQEGFVRREINTQSDVPDLGVVLEKER